MYIQNDMLILQKRTPDIQAIHWLSCLICLSLSPSNLHEVRNLFRYSYKSEVEINATQEAIWQVLKNTRSYHEWNPFTPVIDATWNIGDPVILSVKMKPSQPPMIRKEFLTAFEPMFKMAWGFSWGWMLRAERTQKLIIIDDHTTRYSNEDIITGPVSPLVHLLYGRYIQAGFDAISASLKNFMEK